MTDHPGDAVPQETRSALRRRLLEARQALSPQIHAALSARILEHLRGVAPDDARRIGFYWPFRAEWDPGPFVTPLVEAGLKAALPVVVGPARPLVFRPWTPSTPMVPGPWSIPHPAEGEPVTPDLVLVSLVGFDARGYRLGYGGGFYDRTLAAMRPAPRTIGVGFELGRLEALDTHAYDLPLDWVVTEAGAFRSPSSSPPSASRP